LKSARKEIFSFFLNALLDPERAAIDGSNPMHGSILLPSANAHSFRYKRILLSMCSMSVPKKGHAMERRREYVLKGVRGKGRKVPLH